MKLSTKIPSSTDVDGFTTCRSSFLVMKSPTVYTPFLGCHKYVSLSFGGHSWGRGTSWRKDKCNYS